MFNQSRPSNFEVRYRIYLDESGDHVYHVVNEDAHRFLGLLGCWFKNTDYLEFHERLEDFKKRHFHHHPDNPIILHREDIINKRKVFKILQDDGQRERFDNELLDIIQKANFRVAVVVIDKAALRSSYSEGAGHPYHIGLGFLLQRFAGYLNRINRVGDVMAEARGGTEDSLLKDSYTRVYERGIWGFTPAEFFQSALVSRQLKLSGKKANISGLQLYPSRLKIAPFYPAGNAIFNRGHYSGLNRPSCQIVGFTLLWVAGQPCCPVCRTLDEYC